MKLTFLGTRGYIDPVSRRHRRHTSTLVSYRRRRILLDWGEGWGERLARVRPHAVLITHAHPDHAFGLGSHVHCPVFATKETWARVGDRVPAERRHRLAERRRRPIEGMEIEPFPVLHSLRAPAVGYRIEAGRVAIFYVPDVVWIPDRAQAFDGIRVYVGDGATITRNMIRRDPESGEPFGHANIRRQLAWCAAEGVPEMIVTHCGSDIVGGDERRVGARVRSLAEERGVEVCIAHDGMERVLR
ncbi:MAG TPA: MBL fold metallo-hydrolase [Myxococcota bacterium]|nr:MBL fold metallo-hydrolase [Myxococcota bacterium]